MAISNKLMGTMVHGDDVYGMRDRGSFWSIIKVQQSGQSCQNEWGGYPVMGVGTKKYIMGKWKRMRQNFQSQA